MKSFIISKRDHRTVVGCLLMLSLALTILSTTVTSVISAAATPRKIPIYSVARDDKKISISFDAAWGNEDTQQLIDILSTYNVKATFFIVGEWVDKYPESVKALSDAGHEIQNHSDTHPHMPRLSVNAMANEIKSCNSKIEAITGTCPTLFRAPYGDYNNTLVETLQSLNMYCIQWDVDSLDWKDLSADDITKRVVSRAKSGSIVLFHNAALHTPEALPKILEALLNDGFTFVKISELIYPDVYCGDHEGKQHPST